VLCFSVLSLDVNSSAALTAASWNRNPTAQAVLTSNVTSSTLLLPLNLPNLLSFSDRLFPVWRFCVRRKLPWLRPITKLYEQLGEFCVVRQAFPT